ncbi:MAG: cob(I)yrinic acid a,c-diamide adenosyltransferase [bacterium]
MKGLIYVFTGEGKGKTSAALGLAVRAALRGMKVGIVQWYKEKRWPIAEHKIGEKLNNIQIFPLGSGFYQLPTDHASQSEHRQAARAALKQARELVGKVDVLILDEVINAIGDGLVESKGVMELLNNRGRMHVVLTGRGASKELIEMADLVTECKKIKHPYDSGRPAIAGLDY